MNTTRIHWVRVQILLSAYF